MFKLGEQVRHDAAAACARRSPGSTTTSGPASPKSARFDAGLVNPSGSPRKAFKAFKKFRRVAQAVGGRFRGRSGEFPDAGSGDGRQACSASPFLSPLELPTHANTQRWTLAVVCAATAMLMLDIAVVNTALSRHRRRTSTPGLSGLQWVVDAYTLALASDVLTAGALADRLGRRRLFADRPVGLHARVAGLRRWPATSPC